MRSAGSDLSDNSAELTLSGFSAAASAMLGKGTSTRQIQAARKHISRINPQICVVDPNRRQTLVTGLDIGGSPRQRSWQLGSSRPGSKKHCIIVRQEIARPERPC